MTETKTLKIHQIQAGPFHTHDVVDDEGIYAGMDSYFAQCLVEIDGNTSSEELHFDQFPDFYKMKRHLELSTEPYVLEMDWNGV